MKLARGNCDSASDTGNLARNVGIRRSGLTGLLELIVAPAPYASVADDGTCMNHPCADLRGIRNAPDSDRYVAAEHCRRLSELNLVVVAPAVNSAAQDGARE
jgi:hypothetical protein